MRKEKTPILIFLYTPESYKGDPWTTPQDWTPPADFHAMRNPSNKGWMEVSNVERGNVPPVLKNPEHFLNRAEDRLRKLKEKKKIKIICCCEDCD